MDIKITCRKGKSGGSHYHDEEVIDVEAKGIEGYDADKAVQALLDAAALLKVGAYGNAQLIVSGLKGWEGLGEAVRQD